MHLFPYDYQEINLITILLKYFEIHFSFSLNSYVNLRILLECRLSKMLQGKINF